ncbi:MAG: ABC transporter ATP-binding protein, partial [bacterium]
LIGAGLTVAREGRLVLVAMDGDHAYDVIRDACDDLSLGLVRIERRRQNLEDIFREVPTQEVASAAS